MAGFLPALLCAALPLTLALPPSAEPRLFIPTPATAGSAPQPFAWLHGGSFINPAIPYHADPLARYAWAPGTNASALQIFALLPASVAPMPGTPAASFLNASSLLAQGPSVTVAGAGTLQLDFGLNSAAWIEFDSPDLQASDAAAVTLGVSEYSEYEITNLGAKVLRPVAYPGAAGAATTYRLEIPHPDKSGLYEGVQYAWLSVNATPARPWTITGLRLVCQAKPTNWRGAFAAQGDDLLTQIWYTGAYTVKVNLLGDQFGSILIYRGDRFSWTGDAHVAQASAMAALGNFAFVGTNLNYTKDNCNGIESYCLYLCLSVVDYYFASNDTVTTLALQPHVISKLEHAHDVWGTHVSLGFQGWDDRLGSGFSDSKADEPQALYRHQCITAWLGWARVLQALGNATGAAHYQGYAAAAIAASRAAPSWPEGLGLHSAAEAIVGGWATPAEAGALIDRLMRGRATVCSLSAFNTYFILRALGAAGQVDLGYAVLHACWDVMLQLGASTTYETSKPGWVGQLPPNAPVPAFQDGYTSLAHPWASGATQWASQYLLGAQALAPGFERWAVAPHLAGSMQGVAGVQPLVEEGLGIGVRVGGGAGQGLCVAAPPAPRRGELRLSRALVARVLGLQEEGGQQQQQGLRVLVQHAAVEYGSPECTCSEGLRGGGGVLGQQPAVELVFESGAQALAQVQVLELVAGACNVLHLQAVGSSGQLPAATAATAASPLLPPPLPPAAYPAITLPPDTATQGSWIGKYGQAGHYLVAFDGPGAHRAALPPWVESVEQVYGPNSSGPWLEPSPAQDPRALQDPAAPAGPRRIGQYSAPPPPQPGWAPSFPLDVRVRTPAGNGTLYQYAFYFCDFDGRGRRQSVQLMSVDTLEDIAPVALVEGFQGGVWLVWQWGGGVRMRVNFVRGTNQVLSALLFDVVQASA